MAATPQPRVWEPSYGKALQATRAGESPLLVVLDKPSSETARLAPELLSEDQVSGKSFELLRPYQLCHVDVTTEYGKKVAKAFNATSFPHVAIIDKTGSLVLFSKSGKMNASQWEQALTRHKNGERIKAQSVSHVTYMPAESVIYSTFPSGGSYCPNCQRQSF
jgi:hypothetical protein